MEELDKRKKSRSKQAKGKTRKSNDIGDKPDSSDTCLNMNQELSSEMLQQALDLKAKAIDQELAGEQKLSNPDFSHRSLQEMDGSDCLVVPPFLYQPTSEGSQQQDSFSSLSRPTHHGMMVAPSAANMPSSMVEPPSLDLYSRQSGNQGNNSSMNQCNEEIHFMSSHLIQNPLNQQSMVNRHFFRQSAIASNLNQAATSSQSSALSLMSQLNSTTMGASAASAQIQNQEGTFSRLANRLVHVRDHPSPNISSTGNSSSNAWLPVASNPFQQQMGSVFFGGNASTDQDLQSANASNAALPYASLATTGFDPLLSVPSQLSANTHENRTLSASTATSQYGGNMAHHATYSECDFFNSTEVSRPTGLVHPNLLSDASGVDGWGQVIRHQRDRESINPSISAERQHQQPQHEDDQNHSSSGSDDLLFY